jgi:tellurite resistance protein TerC
LLVGGPSAPRFQGATSLFFFIAAAQVLRRPRQNVTGVADSGAESHMDVLWGEWAFFAAVLAIFVGADLFAHRGQRQESRRQALVWVFVSIALGLGFCGHVWLKLGKDAAQEYFAAYLLEECLSLDNLFVFLIIFRMTGIPKAHQRVALSWGILGALVFRGIFVFVGVEVLHRWAWIEYGFAAVLLYGAWHAFTEDPTDADEDNKLVSWLTRHLPVSRPQPEARFLVREDGRLKATPLLVAIIGLEISDLLFAIDSVPAAFSVTRNEFLIYSSNVFAILGLRSLYIVLAHSIGELKYLHFGLAAVLAFAGVKIILGRLDVHISPMASVGMIVALIGSAVIASLLAARGGHHAPGTAMEEDSTAQQRREHPV